MPAKMNPFEVKTKPADRYYMDWQKLYPRPYDKNEVDPYTRLRIILMNGTEYEANWFSHQFHRHCTNNDLRRELAVLRRTEQQQQKRIACLKPIDESILETTIGYEQLAVDLTAILAQREPDAYVVQVMNLALLEDFDHLYRYADLLELERGIHAERLVGCYTEIMPGRPTIAEHRHPRDSVRKPISAATAAPITKLNAAIITAAEQQTMNYYMAKMFNSMGFGTAVGILFFTLVLFAALTSSIALTESCVSTFEDELGWNRQKSTLLAGAIILILGSLSSLGYGPLAGIKIIGMQFLDFFDFLTNSVMMPIAAFATCLLVSRVIGVDKIEEEVTQSGMSFRRKKIFVFMIKYLCPIFAAIILISSVANALGWISI